MEDQRNIFVLVKVLCAIVDTDYSNEDLLNTDSETDRFVCRLNASLPSVSCLFTLALSNKRLKNLD